MRSALRLLAAATVIDTAAGGGGNCANVCDSATEIFLACLINDNCEVCPDTPDSAGGECL